MTAEIITHSGSTHSSSSRQGRDYAVTSRSTPTDDTIYQQGKGMFWPQGFKTVWDQAKPQRNNITPIDNSCDYLYKILESYMKYASRLWDKTHIIKTTTATTETITTYATKEHYIKLLSYGEPDIANKTIITSSTKKEGYTSLIETITDPTTDSRHPVPDTGSSNHKIYATQHHKTKAITIITQEEATNIITTSKTEITTNISQCHKEQFYLKDPPSSDYAATSFKPSKLLTKTGDILGGILAIFAIWDIYTQITATTKNPKNIINWLNLTSSSIGVAGAIGDVINRITAQKTNAIKWAQEIETPKLLDFEHLGILAAALNATVSAYQCYQSIGQGDRAVTASLATSAAGNSGYTIWKTKRTLDKFIKDGATQNNGDIFIKDSAESFAEDAIGDLGAEATGLLIPGLDILDLILFASQITSFIIMLFKDNKFQHWARTSPFAKEKVTDEVTDQKELLNNLLTILLHPTIQVIRNKEQKAQAKARIYMMNAGFLDKPQFNIEGIWKLTYNSSSNSYPDSATISANNKHATEKDIVLLPQGKIIGKEFVSSVDYDQVVALNQAISNRYRWGSIEANPDTTEQIRFLARGNIASNDCQLPNPAEEQQIIAENKKAIALYDALDKDEKFVEDPNYIYPDGFWLNSNRVYWHIPLQEIQKIVETIRNRRKL